MAVVNARLLVVMVAQHSICQVCLIWHCTGACSRRPQVARVVILTVRRLGVSRTNAYAAAMWRSQGCLHVVAACLTMLLAFVVTLAMAAVNTAAADCQAAYVPACAFLRNPSVVPPPAAALLPGPGLLLRVGLRARAASSAGEGLRAVVLRGDAARRGSGEVSSWLLLWGLRTSGKAFGRTEVRGALGSCKGSQHGVGGQDTCLWGVDLAGAAGTALDKWVTPHAS
jgi:hypothetical protein